MPAVSATAAETFYTGGTVYAVVAAPEKTYVGGDFTLIGRPTGSWVGIDPTGTTLGGRPAVSGTVSSVVCLGPIRSARGIFLRGLV